MPHTRKVGDRHSVTIRSNHRRTGGWESEGDIFLTACCTNVGVTVHGKGRTMTSAEAQAFEQARRWCLTRQEDPGGDE